MSEIDDVRAVLDAATPGPWRWTHHEWNAGWKSDRLMAGDERVLSMATSAFEGRAPSDEDARAIALLGSTWREALDVIEIAASPRQAGLRQAVDAWRAAVREHEGSEE